MPAWRMIGDLSDPKMRRFQKHGNAVKPENAVIVISQDLGTFDLPLLL